MINILSPINQLGYGITGLNIVKSLSQLTQVSLWCIGQPQVTSQEDADVISKCINNAKFFDIEAPCLRIWHQYDMSQFIGKGQRIGFPIFELDTFNNLEKHHLSSLDKIFVCSNWAKQVVLNNIQINPDNISVIPLGVDTSIFSGSDMPQSDTTRFFNCGKWEIRKGHDVLVELFNNAFDPADNVELFLMCSNPFCSEQEEQEWHNLYLKSKLGSKITIIPRQQTQKEVYNIMSQTHCGVFPSRAEGWNLELLEMMACGKHVITTNYSAHTEFCNAENAHLINVEETEIAYDGKWFHGQGNWAKIGDKEKNRFITAMRDVHELRKNGSLITNNNGVNMANKLTWNHSAKEIIKNVL
jgi:glycosyltransferase involved in cell wall biosynthesis